MRAAHREVGQRFVARGQRRRVGEGGVLPIDVLQRSDEDTPVAVLVGQGHVGTMCIEPRTEGIETHIGEAAGLYGRHGGQRTERREGEVFPAQWVETQAPFGVCALRPSPGASGDAPTGGRHVGKHQRRLVHAERVQHQAHGVVDLQSHRVVYRGGPHGCERSAGCQCHGLGREQNATGAVARGQRQLAEALAQGTAEG